MLPSPQITLLLPRSLIDAGHQLSNASPQSPNPYSRSPSSTPQLTAPVTLSHTAVRATAPPPSPSSSDAAGLADIQTEFQTAESLFAHMQQAAAAVIAMSSDDSDAVTADCQQLVDCSRAFAAACPRFEQLQTFLEDKVTQSPPFSAVNQLPRVAAPDTCS